MRAAITLLVLGLVAVVPGVARAESTSSRPSLASRGGDLAGRLGYESDAPYSPSFMLELRAAAGHDEPLLGPLSTYYRTQPELLFGLKPTPKLSLFAGGGLGAAYVVPDAGARCGSEGPVLTLSGALGARFPWERVPVTTALRAQAVTGYGVAVTIDVALALADVK